MSVDSKVELLIKFVAANANGSSPFLSPVIEWTINTDLLLDEVSKIWDIPPKDIGDIVDRHIAELGALKSHGSSDD